ncbi:error-prone DNA polymerase [Spongiibacter tropicus]|uniref:error-prone DNA polymerase n=1 Tax=Spongiibacter tropicus TaxID=454602 RepID=UPI0035BE9113
MPALLNCQSNFSFLSAASHPEELVIQADELGYSAITLCDELSLAGIVRAWRAARERSIRLICGSRISLDDGIQLLLLAPNRRGYNQLCALISHARLNSPKGEYHLDRQTLARFCRDCLAIWLPAIPGHDEASGHFLRECFGERLWLGIRLDCHAQQELHYLANYELAKRLHLPMVAAPHIRMHSRQRHALLDVLTATRLHCSVDQLGQQRPSNSEHHIKPLSLLSRDYPPALLEESDHLAKRCEFRLDELRYQYPTELVPRGQAACDFLRSLTEAGAKQRWPSGVPDTVQNQLERELSLIAELKYEHYFLTVYDIVQFARSQQILCQGRGSAANSAVCYCLYITEVDPSRAQLLFERFISKERNEPPDIDVDFEHERREEVIQYIYRKYGRSHASLAATVISYRRRSAVRDVGKALGLDNQLINQLSKNMAWWDNQSSLALRLSELGISTSDHRGQQFIDAVNALIGFPRHLSQHVGGFVISREPINTLVPQENAAMPERTIIQWDKSDLEALGMLKIDILALGMLSALRRSLRYISDAAGTDIRLSDIPAEDAETYAMLKRADSIGVFQIESRAQMTMLPRLQPSCFYDLVIQIAIVRPGPIQGGMVHPFLRRRQGLEAEHYANKEIEKVLKRTLGVPIFQEQVIQLAMVAAGFSGGEADQLRRAMASWGKNGDLAGFKDKLVNGMLERGYDLDFAERLFSQMKGFGAYGFPESHSASFALLAYASAWIKCHHPAAFYCGLLNSQPMGFYSVSQLCQDAQRHDVAILPVSACHSDWEHRVVFKQESSAIRLGLRTIKGLSYESAQALCQLRQQQAFTSVESCLQRLRSEGNFSTSQLNLLARSDVFHDFEIDRYRSYWYIQQHRGSGQLVNTHNTEAPATLPIPSEKENIQHDYAYNSLSLRRHPMAWLRSEGYCEHYQQAARLSDIKDGQWLTVAGIVSCRQRPGSASGVLFMTLEDDTGNINVIVWPAKQAENRQAILSARILEVTGEIQHSDQQTGSRVTHIIAHTLRDIGALFPLHVDSHDFH